MKKKYSRSNGSFNFLDEQVIYNHWNTLFINIKDIPKHKSLSSKVIKNSFGKYFTLSTIIAEALRNYSVEELKDAITLYHALLTNPEHFYSHRYSLAEFLHYGNRNGTGYAYFIHKPKQIYKKTTDDVIESIRKLFKPITESWEPNNILDTKRNTYYGFPLNAIKNWKGRKYDLELDFKIFEKGGIQSGKKFIPKTEFELTNIWCVEVVIAGMLFHRKELTQDLKDDLKKYFLIWQQLNRGVILWKEIKKSLKNIQV